MVEPSQFVSPELIVSFVLIWAFSLAFMLTLTLTLQAYKLVRSLELEDEVESTTTLASLADACSPLTRVVLGVLRFCISLMASLVSSMYILFGVLYDNGPTRYLGAVSYNPFATIAQIFIQLINHHFFCQYVTPLYLSRAQLQLVFRSIRVQALLYAAFLAPPFALVRPCDHMITLASPAAYTLTDR